MLTASRSASALSSECTDLDAIPRQPAVDYESRIQPIFTSCTGCHGENGSAGLDLRPGQAYANLVGVESTTSPPQARVEPFEPEDSLLLSAINCAITGGPSFQMPGTDPAQRALIRDWIAQGALERPAARSVPAMHPAGLGILAALMLLVLFATRRQRVRSWP
ncbi:MAG: hypothetical protein KGY48_02235 [Wenzhouxiangellaceae bacterium]|nr:hypothetical protein [Wenzhouxiangellaceae bacterium]